MRRIIYQEVSQWIQLQTNQFVWLPTPVSQNRTPASSSIKPGASDARDIMYIFKLSKCNDALHCTMYMTIRIRTTSSNQRRTVYVFKNYHIVRVGWTENMYIVHGDSKPLEFNPKSSFLNETKKRFYIVSCSLLLGAIVLTGMKYEL